MISLSLLVGHAMILYRAAAAEAAGFGLLRCSGVCFIAQDSGAVTWVDTTMCGTEMD